MTMTNRENIQSMNTKEFYEKLDQVLKNPFSAYIDYEKYFNENTAEKYSYLIPKTTIIMEYNMQLLRMFCLIGS